MSNRHRSLRLQLTRKARSRRSLAMLGLAFLFWAVSLQAQGMQECPLKGQGKFVVEEYVGPPSCARCHQDIYRKYLRTGMGRSMTQVSSEWLKAQDTSGSVEDEKNRVQFDVYAQAGKLYQSEHQSGPGGQELFRDTHEIEWIIGAGANS